MPLPQSQSTFDIIRSHLTQVDIELHQVRERPILSAISGPGTLQRYQEYRNTCRRRILKRLKRELRRHLLLQDHVIDPSVLFNEDEDDDNPDSDDEDETESEEELFPDQFANEFISNGVLTLPPVNPLEPLVDRFIPEHQRNLLHVEIHSEPQTYCPDQQPDVSILPEDSTHFRPIGDDNSSPDLGNDLPPPYSHCLIRPLASILPSSQQSEDTVQRRTDFDNGNPDLIHNDPDYTLPRPPLIGAEDPYSNQQRSGPVDSTHPEFHSTNALIDAQYRHASLHHLLTLHGAVVTPPLLHDYSYSGRRRLSRGHYIPELRIDLAPTFCYRCDLTSPYSTCSLHTITPPRTLRLKLRLERILNIATQIINRHSDFLIEIIFLSSLFFLLQSFLAR